MIQNDKGFVMLYSKCSAPELWQAATSALERRSGIKFLALS